MEKNNGRQEHPVIGDAKMDPKAILEENQQLKTICSQMHDRIKQLENGWAIQRAQFLFEVMKTDGFSIEAKQKAQEELEGFLFPIAKPEEEK